MASGRGGWALCALAGTSIAVLAPGASDSWLALTGPSFPDALMALVCLVQLALSVWTTLAVALVLLRAPAPIVRVIAPRMLRRVLLAGSAGALALSPAYADPVAAPHANGSGHDLAGLHLPDRPSVSSPPVTPARDHAVTVRSGDTLWAIAARFLPRGASDAEIARACGRWYATNRRVIGADPNLIFPSQRLVPPPGKDPT